jgi:hypothetical protein
MAISVASTMVMAMVLGERHDLHAPIGHIAIGWTVVEDLLTVAVLDGGAIRVRGAGGRRRGADARRRPEPPLRHFGGRLSRPALTGSRQAFSRSARPTR